MKKNERSIFAARKDLKQERDALLIPIWDTIMKAYRLSEKRGEIYKQYIADLIKVFNENQKPLTVAEIAEALHLSPDEYDSLACSLSHLAVPSISNRVPDLCGATTHKMHHYAELDSHGTPIRYWDAMEFQKVYFVDHKEEG